MLKLSTSVHVKLKLMLGSKEIVVENMKIARAQGMKDGVWNQIIYIYALLVVADGFFVVLAVLAIGFLTLAAFLALLTTSSRI